MTSLLQVQPDYDNWCLHPRPCKTPVEVDMRELGFNNIWTLLPEEDKSEEEEEGESNPCDEVDDLITQPPKVDTVRWSCEKCQSTFKSKKSLYGHTRAVHSEPVGCKECGKLVDLRNINRHEKSHKGILFCCSICGKSRSSAQTLKFHEQLCGKARRNKGHIPCSLCQKTYASDFSLSRHISRDHSVTTSDGSLAITYGPHLPPKLSQEVECILCRKMFRKRIFLNAHMKKVHLAEEEPFETVVIRRVRRGRRYVYLENVVKVDLNPHNNPLYKCTKCPGLSKL